MPHDKVYFTWPDQALSYECRGCAECCKGLGIGIDAAGGQVERLVTLYPGLTAYLRKRGTTWTAFNPRGRCWFLEQDGMCRVETDHGRDTKPAACRLFPFNRVFCFGDYTIVDYNSVICPLAAPAADTPEAAIGMSGRVSHDDVSAEIASISDAGIVGTTLPGTRAAADTFVARERGIAAACFDAAPPADMTGAWQSMSEVPWEDAVRSISVALQGLGVGAWRQPSTADATTALWLTPSLRFNEQFGPRRWTGRDELVDHLPRMWLAWLHFVAVGGGIAARALTMQEATSTWAEQMSLCYLAARWDERASFEPGPVELPGDADPGNVVRKFGEACVANRFDSQTLGDMLSHAFEGVPAHERVALARLAEPVWKGLTWGAAPRQRAPQRRKANKRRRR